MYKEEYTERWVLEPEKDFDLIEINNLEYKSFKLKDYEIANIQNFDDNDRLKIEFSIPSAKKREHNNARVKEFIPLYFDLGTIKDLSSNKEILIPVKEVPVEHPTPNVEEIVVIDPTNKIKGYSNKLLFTEEESFKNQFLDIRPWNTENALYTLEMPCSDSEFSIRLNINQNIFKDFNGSFLQPVIFKAAFDRILLTMINTKEEDTALSDWDNLNKWINTKLPGGYDEHLDENNIDIRDIPEHLVNEFIEDFMKVNFTGLFEQYERLINNERKKYA